jgi:hypothetical protein
MRYQITADWSVGEWLIPSGTVIDDILGTDPWSTLIQVLALAPPVDASPLNQETYNRMIDIYGEGKVRPPPK